jgi:flagellar basal-body rod protein FlgF
MDKALYVSMAGAKQNMLEQAVYANNLANVNTVGFQADLADAMSVMIEGDSFQSRVYAVSNNNYTDFSQSALIHTGRELDVAVMNGFIAVQDNQGGEAYTRAGELSVLMDGRLVNGAGNQVMGDGGPIVIPPYQSMSIGTDGTITIVPHGGVDDAQAVIDRIRLVQLTPQNAQKGLDGLIRTKDGNPAEVNSSVKLESGNLNASNVNAIDSMINIINLARQFDLQVKLMESAETNDEQTARIMQMNG